jgi:NAD(P)-dependent dehydrogenase (short-subunit alcohol dehydrogenase family)
MSGSKNEISYKNLFDLSGKTAVITGAAGILGREFCKGLAECGADIAVVDVDLSSANDVVTLLKDKYSVKAIAVECDVSDPFSVNLMIDSVVSYFGGIDILHNNAAAKSSDLEAFFEPFETYSIDQWRSIMSVNLDGMFLVAQAAGKQMVAQNRGGSIIQTSSIYGVVSPDHRIYEGSFYLGRQINSPAVYAASKSAIVGLTRFLSTYWADKNIRVNTISPGGTESGQNEEFTSRYSNRIPLNRMAKSYEIVGALLYLASDASTYVTGQNIIIDGGLTAW